jgi:excisionase family DNA binding protein
MPKPLPPIAHEWLTVRQAANYLQFHPATIRSYVNAGVLTASQLVPGGKLRISFLSIEKLLESTGKGSSVLPRTAGHRQKED